MEVNGDHQQFVWLLTFLVWIVLVTKLLMSAIDVYGTEQKYYESQWLPTFLWLPAFLVWRMLATKQSMADIDFMEQT